MCPILHNYGKAEYIILSNIIKKKVSFGRQCDTICCNLKYSLTRYCHFQLICSLKPEPQNLCITYMLLIEALIDFKAKSGNNLNI